VKHPTSPIALKILAASDQCFLWRPGSDFSKENARTRIVDEYGITLPEEEDFTLNLLWLKIRGYF